MPKATGPSPSELEAIQYGAEQRNYEEDLASSARYASDDQAAAAAEWMNGPQVYSKSTLDETTGELPITEVGAAEPYIIVLSEPDLTRGGVCRALVKMKSRVQHD